MRRRALSAAAIALASVLAASPLRAQASLEYNVKAAFLLNFARFIEWPDSAFADAWAPINLCVFGANPFGGALERTVQDEVAGGRPFVVREMSTASQAAPCHLIFIPAAMEDRADALLREAASSAVTVGESRRFLELGGAINLVVEGGRVRFNVNLAPVEQRRIRISARMLQLASRVERSR
jgi:hypothetical protein